MARKLLITNSADNPQKDKSELLPQLKQIGPMLKSNLNNMETSFNKFTYCEWLLNDNDLLLYRSYNHMRKWIWTMSIHEYKSTTFLKLHITVNIKLRKTIGFSIPLTEKWRSEVRIKRDTVANHRTVVLFYTCLRVAADTKPTAEVKISYLFSYLSIL